MIQHDNKISRFPNLIPQICAAVSVWIKVNIIGVYVVLYHMTVNPINLGATNPIEI